MSVCRCRCVTVVAYRSQVGTADGQQLPHVPKRECHHRRTVCGVDQHHHCTQDPNEKGLQTTATAVPGDRHGAIHHFPRVLVTQRGVGEHVLGEREGEGEQGAEKERAEREQRERAEREQRDRVMLIKLVVIQTKTIDAK